MTSRRDFLRLGGAAAGTTLVAGCGGLGRGQPVPNGQVRQATILGLPNERFFPLLGAEGLDVEFNAAAQRQSRRLGVASADLDFKLLAVSGGGENGAFGAGLLCGWTAHGDRPTFDLVTGVSTGALTAPLAFLGAAYDPQLRYVYTDIGADDVLSKRFITAALFSDALADNTPLYRTISRVLDARMLAAIAQGYDDGRLLLIGTTDLDAQQPVIWNIGAIARSGHPRALDTVRRILLASAAIPGAFPPTMFDATLDGKPYQEMHVDGGAFVQSFLYPGQISQRRRREIAAGVAVPRATAYLIRNGRLDANWSEVQRQTLGIVGRAIETMIFANGYNDTLRIYNIALRDHVDYNLAFIGTDFRHPLPAPFDRDYMRTLFDYGYDRARIGYDWAKAPALAGVSGRRQRAIRRIAPAAVAAHHAGMPQPIRSATHNDLPDVESIVRQAYSPYVSRIGREPGPMLDDYRSLIEAGRVHLAERGDRVKGVLVLIPESDAMLLDNIAVDPGAQGTGVGRRLLEYAEQAARAAGYRTIKLYTHETMTENIGLYTRIGYVETHRAEEKGFRRVYMAKALD